jgi:hypothetical protein
VSTLSKFPPYSHSALDRFYCVMISLSKTMVLSDVTQCSLVHRYQWFHELDASVCSSENDDGSNRLPRNVGVSAPDHMM